MENQVKKRKIHHDNMSLDPSTVPGFEDFQELIFQHLSGKEVLKCFKVSPKWHEIASESQKAMSKILLKLIDQNNEDIVFSDVLKSHRSYQNVSLSAQNEYYLERALACMKKFSKFVVSLTISCDQFNVDSFTLFPLPEDFMMPKLKRLELLNSRFIIFACLIGLCQNIEEIVREDDGFEDEDFLVLKNRKHLKKMVFKEFNANRKDLLEAKFKLESFHFCRLRSPENNENVRKFFTKMAPTLTSLTIENINSKSFGILWLLPNLRELKLSTLEVTKEDFLAHRKPLPNIQVLRIQSLSKRMRIFIRLSLVNVKTLHLKVIKSEEKFEWIARNMKSLQNLELPVFRQDQKYNKNIRVTLSDDI